MIKKILIIFFILLIQTVCYAESNIEGVYESNNEIYQESNIKKDNKSLFESNIEKYMKIISKIVVSIVISLLINYEIFNKITKNNKNINKFLLKESDGYFSHSKPEIQLKNRI